VSAALCMSNPRHASAVDRWFKPITKGEVVRIMRAARHWADDQPRKRGERWGPLSPIDLKVLETLLFKAMTWRSGQLDWSYVQIAAAVKRSKQTVARSLARLKAEGFIEWLRRFEPAETVNEWGPQVRQMTNAYRVLLPAKVKAWLERRFGPPVPVDHEQARAARAAELREMAAQEWAIRYPEATEKAAREAEAERESTNWTHSPDKVFHKR